MDTQTKDLGEQSKLTKKQVKKFTKLVGNEKIIVNVRYDDECGNGHNTFSITADIYENGRFSAGGCMHEEIAKHFPELEPLIKWHLCSSDGPLHYVANTLWHISDKDCWGLKKGEFNSFQYHVVVNGGVLFESRVFYSFRNWLHEDEAKNEAENFIKNVKEELNPQIIRVGTGEPSEGKKIDIEAARSCAIWPNATLEQLQDKAQLEARLPKLLREFRKDIESFGFTY